MSSIKIKAPYEFMESKQFKLFDFVPEFSEFRQFDDLSRFGCENIENNLIRLEKRGKIHFENRVAICPSCKSHNAVKLEAAWKSKDKSLACKLEYQIKTLSKMQKEALINGEKLSSFLSGKVDCRRYKRITIDKK